MDVVVHTCSWAVAIRGNSAITKLAILAYIVFLFTDPQIPQIIRAPPHSCNTTTGWLFCGLYTNFLTANSKVDQSNGTSLIDFHSVIKLAVLNARIYTVAGVARLDQSGGYPGIGVFF